MNAIDEEFHGIETNNTWDLTCRPLCKKAIGVKWECTSLMEKWRHSRQDW